MKLLKKNIITLIIINIIVCLIFQNEIEVHAFYNAHNVNELVEDVEVINPTSTPSNTLIDNLDFNDQLVKQETKKDTGSETNNDDKNETSLEIHKPKQEDNNLNGSVAESTDDQLDSNTESEGDVKAHGETAILENPILKDVSYNYYTVNSDGASVTKHTAQIEAIKVTKDTMFFNQSQGGWYYIEAGETVTIENVQADKMSDDAIYYYGHVNLILEDDAVLITKGIITNTTPSSINIYGQTNNSGKLISQTQDGPGIGGAGADGIVTIHGGNIIAKGPTNHDFNAGAGIGGGWETHGVVTIFGGHIVAAGGDTRNGTNGAGIGGGYAGNGTVIIYGGDIQATGIGGAAGIGGGNYKNGVDKSGDGDVKIYGGNITANGGVGAAGIGAGKGGSSTIIINDRSNKGHVTANGGAGGAGIGSGAGQNSTITIEAGLITAIGGSGAAGVGTGANASTTINIYSGEVSGEGGNQGAGIGAGNNSLVDINITGGFVTGIAGNWAAGIGAGDNGSPANNISTIDITDAEILATGGTNGAGIGGGDNGATNIQITNSEVTATGGTNGAGIGGGYNGQGTITIKNGTINTTGGTNGSGIGGGSNSHGIITITGSNVTTTGGESGAGIGGGFSGQGTVTINSGNIQATGGTNGAGIGGGSSGQGTVTIENGTINATSPSSGAGIGGGNNRSATITINNGNVIAKSNSYGAGIGSGSWPTDSATTIVKLNGGIIKATSGDAGNNSGAGIGGGYHSSHINIAITNVILVEASGGPNADGIGFANVVPNGKNKIITVTNERNYGKSNTSLDNIVSNIPGKGDVNITDFADYRFAKVTAIYTDNEILTFNIPDQVEDTVIDSENSYIYLKMPEVIPNDLTLENLTPNITVSDGATISPETGVVRDFTKEVIYTVTSGSGITREWTVKVYQLPLIDVTLDANGGDLNGKASYIFEKDKELGEGFYKFQTPTYVGYVFKGWYETQDGTGKQVTDKTRFLNNVTLYAKWEKETVSLDITWGDMDFEYVIDRGIWNSDTHEYMEGTYSGGWNFSNFTSENNQVNVTNHSNIPVSFDIDVNQQESYGLDIGVYYQDKHLFEDDNSSSDSGSMLLSNINDLQTPLATTRNTLRSGYTLKRFTNPITLYPQISPIEPDTYYVYVTGTPVNFNYANFTPIGGLVLTVNKIEK